ncbi:ATP-binding cassette transporter abc1 [Sodiomyces alkalinus F11]|uniref:ATP-binding cassette transporter abc1 n=1 Tax=Sodiomyces alkalinus (strain CBS 110278 / VKM F-3762 / F11) TaxID=1314773 RepID=A0A3N2Q1M0_SODAK|nr:ATP-binding cassette transporter abc1 [Sodiomyces alkalinus F11]ROT40654.1 ATP-binding cassette transporter abc1 [Sodiomyces alkalinus F11]
MLVMDRDIALEKALIRIATAAQREQSNWNVNPFYNAEHAQLPWIESIVAVSEAGHIQCLVMLGSLLWTSFRLLNRAYARRPLPRHVASAIRWPWEACALASRTASLSFLALAAAKGETTWLNAACVTYALAIGLFRLVDDLEWRHIALQQVNFVLIATLLLLAAPTVLPCTNARQACFVEGPLMGALMSLVLSVLVALFTPREWVPPSLRYDLPKGAVDKDPAPEETCSWAQYFLTYDWLTPLIWKGTRGAVTLDDLPRIAWYDDPLLLLSKVKDARAKGKSTFWTLLRLLHEEVTMMACFIASAYILELIAPFALYRLLSYLADPQGSVIRPWVWLLLMFSGPISRSVVFQQYIFTSTRLIVRVKSAMTQELYHRAMSSREVEDDIFSVSATTSPSPSPSASTSTRKSRGSRKAAQTSTSAGRLANLMAADVDALWGSRDIVMICIGLPIGTAAAIVGLFKILGWPSIVGAFVLLLASPISIFIAQLMAKVTRTVRRAQDSRISLVSEYLSSIRAIKYFAWEDAAIGKIQDARAIEQRHLWRVSALYVSLSQVTQLIPYIALLLMFSLHVVVRKQKLDAATAFTTAQLVKNIRKNITQAGSLSRNVTAAMVALDRLDRYFESTVVMEKYAEGPLRIQDGLFRRNALATFRLQNVSVTFVEGGLNVVAGHSGSGKTTLLLAILGEAERLGGMVTRPRDVAFAPQTTWLQNETIRENILFQAPFEKARYDRVLEACCLLLDLNQMDHWDQTVVGENGASLSGGQKARIALARALYSKAPLILLDDIFSALDSKTSALLWERCFCTDMLKGRTTVLVAQQPWVALQSDLCIILENGTVSSVEQNIGVVRHAVASAFPEEEGGDEMAGLEMRAEGPESELESRSDSSLHDTSKTAGHQGEKDLVAQEMKASGKNTRLTFFKYMTYFGGPLYAIACILLQLCSNLAWMASSLWLSVWVEAYSKEEAVNIAFYLGVYAAFAAAERVSSAAIILAYENGAWRAARKLHNDFIRAVMGVSLSWFKNVPVGRVINRFSRDMYSLDSMVSTQLRNFLDYGMNLLFRIGAISSILPIFVVPAAVTCFVGVIVGEMYTRTAVTVKKLVSSAQSPVFTQFSDTLAGLAVIRAREGMTEAFGEALAERLRVWSRAAEANYNCNRWVAMRVDFITALVGLCAGVIAVSKAGVVAAGLVGFSLTNATGLSQTILLLVRSMNDLEVELQSFIRVREYAGLEPEDKSDKSYAEEGEYADEESHVIPQDWPATGRVELRNVTIRYEPDGPDILADVNLTFEAGERVAIVGRTGSGKSTLVLSLLRFTHIVSGQILYDGIDVTKIPRRRLREALTIIPQEAVLFNGTVESNLDPTGRVPEDDLKRALQSCQGIAAFKQQQTNGVHTLQTNGNGNGNGNANGNGHNHDGERRNANGYCSPMTEFDLDTHVNPKGENFSHGQRQVLSLCRALVRKSPLMLLDEATASMDYETDRGIQEVLRKELDEAGGGRTLVTIAHRLRTIIDYDMVVVMSGGRVAEVGSPSELYAKGGLFTEMVLHSGESDELIEALKTTREAE